MKAKATQKVISLPDVSSTCFQAYKDVNEVHAFQKFGAANGTRTRDPKIHNLVL